MAEYIDRDELLKELCTVSAPIPSESWIVEKCIEKVNEQPTADVTPKSEGWWLYHEDRCSYICSECEEDAITDYYGEPNFTKYCPNCGVRMKGGE